ncbi:hypothetical protein CISG_05713 [Coccidioides immitis RMSCC 3703]|uniref:Uncharacterized protein n=2 Tax=Coccidioides immitis TaxID=5501 RepID=A0A0J8QX42_COCIT|nr:hypothetical protein CIRG_05676 [Coccidioides immitis RMSCC 2394]KMU76570.1 hypothetical protein CISG_05713 [Coccidioides immitis RMSCC 3703]
MMLTYQTEGTVCGVKRWYGFRDQSISKIILTVISLQSSLKTLPADTPQALAEATSGGSPSDKVAESSVDDEAIKSEQAKTLQKHALDTPNDSTTETHYLNRR